MLHFSLKLSEVVHKQTKRSSTR